jgi:ribosomal protein S27E
MKKVKILRLLLLIIFSLSTSHLHTRPGMGGSYRSGSSSLGTSKSSSSTYRSPNSRSNSPTIFTSSSSVRSSSIPRSEGDSSVSIVSSSTWDLKIKIQKQGDILVEEAYSPEEIKDFTTLKKIDPDIPYGILTSSPPERKLAVSQYLTSEAASLKYNLEKVFHPIYNENLGYINLQQPLNNKNYSILIEQEEGLNIPSIDFWVANGGSSNYDGTNPYQYFIFEKELEIGKKYEFENDEYRHTLYFYIKYPINSSSPITTPIPLPESSVSYDSTIILKKSGLSQVSTKIGFSLKELPSLYVNILPNSTDYFGSGEGLQIAYPSFSGDWEYNPSGQNRFPNLKSNQSEITLNYESYGNYIEKDGKIEFDFHIPYLPLYTHQMYLKSYNIQLKLPEGIEEDKIRISLYSATSGYSEEGDPSVILHPVSFEKEGTIYSIKSLLPISLPARLVVNVELPASNISVSTALHYFYLVQEAVKSPLNFSLVLFSLPVYFLILLLGFVTIKIFQKRNPVVQVQATEIEIFLKEKDPNFSLSEFQKRANQIATILQTAWNTSNMEKARPFLSSGVFSRMNTQLELLEKKDGVVNKMSDFKILSSSIEGHALENSYYSIHLKMNFIAKDVTLPKESSTTQIQNALDSVNPQPYSEIYSFTRRLSATSDHSKSLLDGKCPSCGNLADFSHPSVKCMYCGNIYNSGEKDWVLSEITQLVVWKGAPLTSSTDYSTQVLEDRASSLFWKYLKAKTLGNYLSIARESDSKYLSKETFHPSEIFIPVVGGVDLEKFEKVNDTLSAQLQIKWSSASKKNGEITAKQSKLFMKRNSSASDTGFSESSCSQCGAPFPELDSIVCEYCNTKIPNIVDDWIISEIVHSQPI